MSAVFAHQPLALPQKIDSRGGLFGNKMGWPVNVGKMYFYLIEPPFAPDFELFEAKISAFSTKTHCNLVQNALRFGAKCLAFWC